MSDTSLDSLCNKLVTRVSGQAAGAVVGLLIQVLTEEEDKIESIDKKLGKLIRACFNTGMNYLEEIARLEDPQRKANALSQAQHQFMLASEVDAPLFAVKTQFYTGVCFLLMGEGTSGHHWIEKSYLSACAVEESFLKEAEFTGFDGLLSLSPVITPITLPFVFKRFIKKERYTAMLFDLYAFMRSLSDLMFAMGFTTQGLKPSSEIKPPAEITLHGEMKSNRCSYTLYFQEPQNENERACIEESQLSPLLPGGCNRAPNAQRPGRPGEVVCFGCEPPAVKIHPFL